MQSTWRQSWSVLVVAALVMVLSGVVMAGNSSRNVVVSHSGEDGETVVAEPGNRQVMVLAGPGAWLGVNLAEVAPEKVAELKLKEESGAIVTEVVPGSPAAKAGLQANDVILEYQGQRVESAAELRRLVQETPPGRTVRLVVSRNGQRQNLTAKLEQRRMERSEIRIPPIRVPEIHIPPIEGPEVDVEVFRTGPRLGILADELTPQLAEYFGVRQGKGVLVTEVREGTPAAKAGLKAGDVIVRLDEQEIASLGDLRRALRNKKGGDTVTLLVVRQRAEQSLKLQLEEPRRPERRTAGRLPNSEDLVRAYQTSIEQFKERLQTMREELRQQLADKQRVLEESLLRLREQLREYTSL